MLEMILKDRYHGSFTGTSTLKRVNRYVVEKRQPNGFILVYYVNSPIEE